ncbi:MAG: hypothetical protein C5617_004545 [ANME-2 cluster archaeon]|jgi:hypothetical protein|nr:MAG: hypothetical protein C5617_004545 [ANME-2 cluster archaeon]
MVRVIHLVTAILILSALAMPALGDDAIKRELVEQVSEIKLPVLARYQELGLMHRQILITLQTLPSDQITGNTREWVNIAAGNNGILKKFGSINDLASKGDPQSHKTALTDATRLKSDINSLEGYAQAKDNFITSYPKTALSNFFTDQGEYFEALAETEIDTRMEIDYLSHALTAYKEAEDITKTTYIDLKVKKLKSEYQFDMEIVNTSSHIGEAKFEEASYGFNHTSNPVAVATGILSARTAKRELTTVYELYLKHGDERAVQIDEQLLEIDQIHAELVDLFLKYASAFVVFFIVVLVCVLSLMFRWTHAVDDTLLGDEVIQ